MWRLRWRSSSGLHMTWVQGGYQLGQDPFSELRILELMIGWHPLLHTGPFRQRKSIQEKLQCLFSGEAEAGCCYHPYPSYPITSQEGGGVWRLEPERFSTQWLCHLVKIFRIPWALKFPFLPSPSQRVSIKGMWGNGPICAFFFLRCWR